MYDYAEGKAGWLAESLPSEGTRPAGDRVDSHLGPEPVTCPPGDTLGGARALMAAADDDECFVLTPGRIVLGRVRLRDVAEAADEISVTDAMFDGPSTYRPNVPVAELGEIMRTKNLARLPITTASGVLLGVVRREELLVDPAS